MNSSNQLYHNLRIAMLLPLSFGATLLIVGCQRQSWQVETYSAQGTISINGHSPEGAMVIFIPLGKKPDSRGASPWGKVKADGTYVLSMYDIGDGIPKGEYAVTLRWPTAGEGTPVDRLQGAFSTVEKSPLVVTIDREMEVPPIELKGVKVLPAKGD